MFQRQALGAAGKMPLGALGALCYSADMAKSKNHTTQPVAKNGIEMAPKNSDPKHINFSVG